MSSSSDYGPKVRSFPPGRVCARNTEQAKAKSDLRTLPRNCSQNAHESAHEIPSKIDVLCVILHEGSDESAHESAHGKFDSAHKSVHLVCFCLFCSSASMLRQAEVSLRSLVLTSWLCRFCPGVIKPWLWAKRAPFLGSKLFDTCLEIFLDDHWVKAGSLQCGFWPRKLPSVALNVAVDFQGGTFCLLFGLPGQGAQNHPPRNPFQNSP